MHIQQFEHAIRKDDFAVGNSFWINDWEFEVVNTRKKSVCLYGDERVFKWELTRQEFVQVITDNYPEIKNAEEFFSKHGDDVIHYFTKGFDVLVGECGATYRTVMNNAIDEVVKQGQHQIQNNCKGVMGK